MTGYSADELRLIAAAVAEMAISKRSHARSRRYTGDRFANIRTELRQESRVLDELAARIFADSARTGS